MKKNILKEQIDTDCVTSFPNSPNLQLFCNYGCFKTEDYEFKGTKNISGIIYSVVKDKRQPNVERYIAISNDLSSQEGKDKILKGYYYLDANLKTPLTDPDDTENKTEEVTFGCKSLTDSLKNLTQEGSIKKIVELVKGNAETGEILDLEEGFKVKPSPIKNGYRMVSLINLRAYIYGVKSDASDKIITASPELIFWQKDLTIDKNKSEKADVIEYYMGLGYDETDEMEIGGKECVNLKETKYSSLFAKNYYMCKTSSVLNKYPAVKQLKDYYEFIQNTENSVFDKKMKQVDEKGKTVREEQSSRFCQNFIKNYKIAYEKKLPIEQNTLNSYKTEIIKPCIDTYNTFFSRNFYDEFKNIDPFKTQYGNRDYSLESYLKRNMTYEIKNSIKKNLIMIKENKKRISNDENFDIGSTIRKNLILVNENKKRVINEETKIIRHRLNLIAENTKLETKKDVYRLTDKLIIEMLNLSKKGYNKKIINEQYVEMISSIFNSTPNYIMQIFKERFAEYIIGKIAPEYQDAFLSDFIKVSIGTLQIKDITKLTDCDFLTKKLSTDLVETLIKKGGEKMGADNLFYDYVRKIIVDNLKQSDIGQKFQNFFKDFICLSLPNIKDRMSKATDDIKKAAIDTVNKKTLPSGT